MKFLLCNFVIEAKSVTENLFDQKVIKELAYNSKVVSKLPDGTKSINYNFVLVPLSEAEVTNEENASIIEISTKIEFQGEILDYDYSIALAKIFNNSGINIYNTKMSIFLLGEIDDSKLDIFYTDGSFKKATDEASYALTKFLKEDVVNGKKDLFTGKFYMFQTFSEKISDSTNNIGELTGIKKAVENFGDKQYQVIVSDSEYGIKCFREWYYNWKNNGFKTYAKKDIQNKDLIKEIYNNSIASGKIVIFKWVKGHNNDYFNELCDELAKEALK